MENIEQFLQHYGYIAVAIGTFLEGEIFLIVAGIFVKLGYLSFLPSWFFSIIGALLHELIYFFIGKWKGREFLLKNSYTRKKYRKAKSLISKYGVLSIFIVRFMYGMRIVPMVLMGAVGFNTYKFIFFNILSLMVWAFLYLYAGILFGKAAEIFFGKAKEYYITFAILILTITTLILIFFYIKHKLFNNKD